MFLPSQPLSRASLIVVPVVSHTEYAEHGIPFRHEPSARTTCLFVPASESQADSGESNARPSIILAWQATQTYYSNETSLERDYEGRRGVAYHASPRPSSQPSLQGGGRGFVAPHQTGNIYGPSTPAETKSRWSTYCSIRHSSLLSVQRAVSRLYERSAQMWPDKRLPHVQPYLVPNDTA